MARIYVASSWRNSLQAEVVDWLRSHRFEVYDFKSKDAHPAGGPAPTAFSWAELDPAWKDWTPREYRDSLLTNPRAHNGYLGDLRGMEWADTCVLLMPCGRSAHIEAGYMKGRGKRLVVFYPSNSREGFEPDLMYLVADNIAIGWDEFRQAFRS